MRYNQEMHRDIEAINDMITALHARLKEFHEVYGDLRKHSAYFCDTTNLNFFADDLDGFKADEVEPVLEQVRNAFEREHAEADTTEADEISMLHFY